MSDVKAANRYVYRFENDKGEGPYQCVVRPAKSSEYWPSTPRADKQPDPFSDFKMFEADWGSWGKAAERRMVKVMRLMESYKFAFSTKKAAAEWFDEVSVRRMAKYGFRLKRKLAREVVVSDSGRQCVFKPAKIDRRRKIR